MDKSDSTSSMYILGISAFYHDSAAAIIFDGKVLAAAQEERFSRKKHDAGFPSAAIKYCLQEADVSIDDLQAVVFYDKPLLKFERLLETYYAYAPSGLRSFVKAMPVWIKEKMFLKKLIRDELKKIEQYNKKNLKLLFPEHHFSHASSAFYSSPFDKAAILSVDGVGEWATTTISKGEGNKISILKEQKFPHSVGLLYSSFTYYLGFRVNSGEYKLMGLAPYGNPTDGRTINYINVIKNNLCTIYDDGSIFLHQEYFDYSTGLKMVKKKRWQKLFGFPRRAPEDKILQEHCDLALAIQTITDEIILKLAIEAKKISGSENLCLAGGVALNCVANGKLLNEQIFSDIYIQPAAGDAGGAIGAALAACYTFFDMQRNIIDSDDLMNGALLGPSYENKQIVSALKSFSAIAEYIQDQKQLCERTAELIAKGNIIGWFQGRMEFGPRALGNRSILADPRDPTVQKKLNLKIKFRESFRPFAPAVLAEDADCFFQLKKASPYMLIVQPVQKSLQKELPSNYFSFSMDDKLNFQKSDLPAVTHVDMSARIQTVDKNTNEIFYSLLQSFKSITGTGVLVNTSFNVRGEPIVNTPEEAYTCFMQTDMDYLVIGNYFIDKKKQPL